MVSASWKKAAPTVLTALYWILALLYWESLLHAAVFGGFGMDYWYAAGFSVSLGALPALAVSFLKKGRFAGNVILTLVLAVLYGSQLVYNSIFGTLYSAAMMAQGGEAMTSFWWELLSTMGEKCLWLIALFVPLAALLFLRKWMAGAMGLGGRALLLVLTLGAFGLTRYGIHLSGSGMFTDEAYYTNGEIATNQTAQRFGLLTAFRLELTRKQKTPEQAAYYIPVEEAEEQPKEYGYNVLEIDWDALNAQTEDKTLLAINEYCSQLTGTRQNEYTGLLKDYNLIVMCAESFDTGAIQPE